MLLHEPFSKNCGNDATGENIDFSKKMYKNVNARQTKRS